MKKRNLLKTLLLIPSVALLSVPFTINSIAKTNVQQQYSEPSYRALPSGVTYQLNYQITQNETRISVDAILTGLASNNNSYSRNFRIRIQETNNGGQTNTTTIGSFTTPSSGTTYTRTITNYAYNFHFSTKTYKLILEVRDGSNWYGVSNVVVTAAGNIVTPNVTNQNYVITPSGDSMNNGSIQFNYTVANPSNQNYSIAITVQSCASGCYQQTIVFNQSNTTGFVTFTGMPPGQYTATFVVNNVTGVNTAQLQFVVTELTQTPPSATFNQSVVINASSPTSQGQIQTSITITNIPANVTNVIAQTSINGGTSWQTTGGHPSTPYTYNVNPGTYIVMGRLQYTYLTSTRYVTFTSQQVSVGAAAWPEPDGTFNAQTVNSSNPIASDGKIWGDINITLNDNNNILSKEISLDNVNWFDSVTGISGLTRGTYTVFARIGWSNGLDANTYYKALPQATIAVSSNPFNSPTGLLNSTQTFATDPNGLSTITPGINLTSVQNAVAMGIVLEISYGTSTTPGTWIDITTDVTPAIQSFPPGTDVYIYGRIGYYPDGVGIGVIQYINLGSQMITTSNNPWTLPEFYLSANSQLVSLSQGEVNTSIMIIGGDLEALTSMTIELRDENNVIVDQINNITPNDFVNGVYSTTFGGLAIQPGQQLEYSVVVNGVYNLDAPGYGPTSLPTYTALTVLSEFDEPIIDFVGTQQSNTTAQGVDDGTLTIQALITDPGGAMINVTSKLQIWDSANAIWVDATASVPITIEAAPILTEFGFTGLEIGTYRVVVDYDRQLDPSGTLPAVHITTYSNATVTIYRDWNFPIVKTVQDIVVSDPIISNFGYDRYIISYLFEVDNPDSLPFSLRVTLWNSNTNTQLDEIIINTSSNLVYEFTDVPAGNYQLRFDMSMSQNSIQGIDLADKDVDITDTTILPTMIQQTWPPTLWKSQNSSGQWVGNLELLINVSNPALKYYNFTVLITDLTNNLQIYSNEISNQQNVFRVCLYDLPFGDYKIEIINYSGVLIQGIDLNAAYFTLDASLPTTNPLATPVNNIGAIVGWVLGSIGAVGLGAFLGWWWLDKKKHRKNQGSGKKRSTKDTKKWIKNNNIGLD